MQSIPMTTFSCFLISTYLSLRISFHLSKIHIPPPWPITGMLSYVGNHFCVLQVCLKHRGVHQCCQLSVAGNLLCKLASFTPHAEDPQDLTQQDGSPGLQPSLSWVYDTTLQSHFSLTWAGKGTSTCISMCFDRKYTKVYFSYKQSGSSEQKLQKQRGCQQFWACFPCLGAKVR